MKYPVTMKVLLDLESKLSSEISKAKNERGRVRQDIANLACPFNLGDLLIDKNGREAFVHEIVPSTLSNRYEIRLSKKNADGTPSKKWMHFYTDDGWRLKGE